MTERRASTIMMRDHYALEIARAIAAGRRPDPFAVQMKAEYDDELRQGMAA